MLPAITPDITRPIRHLDRDHRVIAFRTIGNRADPSHGTAAQSFWDIATCGEQKFVILSVRQGMFLEGIPGKDLPTRLDAARVRRLIPDADTRLPLMIRKNSS